MVKFGKNKFKALHKFSKKQRTVSNDVSNKVIKKKLNAEKKVSFQKEILLKQATESPLVKNVTAKEMLLDEKSKKKAKETKPPPQEETDKVKVKSVQKQKKRQKTQFSDAKLLLSLMKKNSKK